MAKKPKYTYDTLSKKINEYIAQYNDVPVFIKSLAKGTDIPTKAGFCLYLNISKMTLSNWLNDKKCDNSSYDDDNVDEDRSFKRLIEDAHERIQLRIQAIMLYCETQPFGKSITSLMGYLNSSAYDWKGIMGNPNKSSEMTLTIKMDKEMEEDAR